MIVELNKAQPIGEPLPSGTSSLSAVKKSITSKTSQNTTMNEKIINPHQFPDFDILLILTSINSFHFLTSDLLWSQVPIYMRTNTAIKEPTPSIISRLLPLIFTS